MRLNSRAMAYRKINLLLMVASASILAAGIVTFLLFGPSDWVAAEVERRSVPISKKETAARLTLEDFGAVMNKEFQPKPQQRTSQPERSVPVPAQPVTPAPSVKLELVGTFVDADSHNSRAWLSDNGKSWLAQVGDEIEHLNQKFVLEKVTPGRVQIRLGEQLVEVMQKDE